MTTCNFVMSEENNSPILKTSVDNHQLFRGILPDKQMCAYLVILRLTRVFWCKSYYKIGFIMNKMFDVRLPFGLLDII